MSEGGSEGAKSKMQIQMDECASFDLLFSSDLF